MSVYEVHVGSWRRDPGDPARMLTYRELAPLLAAYLEQIGVKAELQPTEYGAFLSAMTTKTSCLSRVNVTSHSMIPAPIAAAATYDSRVCSG